MTVCPISRWLPLPESQVPSARSSALHCHLVPAQHGRIYRSKADAVYAVYLPPKLLVLLFVLTMLRFLHKAV